VSETLFKRGFMKENYTLHFVKSEEEVALFWQMLYQYFNEDIFPNTIEPVSEEDYEYFFSKKYKDAIMKLYYNESEPLYIVFLRNNDKNIGFATYKTYHSEDGKCFILEFCILKEYRNKGIGTLFFEMLRQHEKNKGAQYCVLNVTSEGSVRFWKRHGFVKMSVDEYGSDVYEKRPL